MTNLSDSTRTCQKPCQGHQGRDTTAAHRRWDLPFYDKSKRHAPFWSFLISFVSLTLLSPTAWADSDILWLVESGEKDHAEAILDGVKEALGDEATAHLFDHDDLLLRVDGRTRPFSGCAFGLQPCMNAEAMAFDALGISLVIRLNIQGRPNSFEVRYEMIDRRRTRADSGRLRGTTGRAVGFALVSELFDAVGVVSFESDPPGATILLDDASVGTTPLSRQVPLGEHNYRLELDSYLPVQGTLAIRSGEALRISQTLRLRPGTLRVQGAPDNAILLVDDEPYGRTTETLELTPGSYTIAIQADGFHPHREQIEITGDELTVLNVTLVATNPLMREIPRDAVIANPFQVDLGLELGLQLGSFTRASGSNDNTTFAVQGWLSQGELAPDARRFLSPAGLRLGAGWEGKHFGLTVLSLSLHADTLDYPIRLTDTDGNTIDARAQSYRNTQLRPLQLRYRFFYEHVLPTFQAGFGVAFHRLDVEVDGEELVRLRQFSPFFNAEANLRYHFTPKWSVGGTYRLSYHFPESMSMEHHLGVFVGFGFPHLPGINLHPPEAL